MMGRIIAQNVGGKKLVTLTDSAIYALAKGKLN
jgi:hypothetical protein